MVLYGDCAHRTLQYLPMATVGGYLGFLGFFMGKAGLSFMTETQLNGPATWWHMLSDPHSLAKIAPGACVTYFRSLA